MRVFGWFLSYSFSIPSAFRLVSSPLLRYGNRRLLLLLSFNINVYCDWIVHLKWQQQKMSPPPTTIKHPDKLYCVATNHTTIHFVDTFCPHTQTQSHNSTRFHAHRTKHEKMKKKKKCCRKWKRVYMCRRLRFVCRLTHTHTQSHRISESNFRKSVFQHIRVFICCCFFFLSMRVWDHPVAVLQEQYSTFSSFFFLQQ